MFEKKQDLKQDYHEQNNCVFVIIFLILKSYIDSEIKLNSLLSNMFICSQMRQLQLAMGEQHVLISVTNANQIVGTNQITAIKSLTMNTAVILYLTTFIQTVLTSKMSVTISCVITSSIVR